MNKIYDYLIVGSGAGGSAAAYALAKADKNVLLLKKGEPLPRDGSTLDVDLCVGLGRSASVDDEGKIMSLPVLGLIQFGREVCGDRAGRTLATG